MSSWRRSPQRLIAEGQHRRLFLCQQRAVALQACGLVVWQVSIEQKVRPRDGSTLDRSTLALASQMGAIRKAGEKRRIGVAAGETRKQRKMVNQAGQ